MIPDKSTIDIMKLETITDRIESHFAAAFAAGVPLVVGSLVWLFLRDAGWLAIALTTSSIYVLVLAVGQVSSTVKGVSRWNEMRHLSEKFLGSESFTDDDL